MSLPERLGTSIPAIGAVAVSTFCVYLLVIALIPVGSVSLSQGAAGLLVLFGLQAAIAVLRRRGALGGLVDNSPLLLTAGSQVLDDHLRQTRVRREELGAQLRAAGVQQLDQVHAVVVQTTGELSVPVADRPLDAQLLRGVLSAGRL